jgi:hypothetical protein
MKTIVIGDIHGRTVWKLIIQTEKPDFVIFMGDYFDNKDGISAVEQLHNFLEIVAYKKENSDKCVLLLGNHDLSYWPGIYGAGVSGYQAGAAASFTQALLENKEYLQMAYGDGERIYTHAGVSKVWLEANGWGDDAPIVPFVNELWEYKPLAFEFNGIDPYGDSVTQGPTWIRPRSLMKSWQKDKDKPTQVVGHTQVLKIDLEGTKKWTNGKLIMVDALGTSQEYLIINDGEISVGKYLSPWSKN